MFIILFYYRSNCSVDITTRKMPMKPTIKNLGYKFFWNDYRPKKRINIRLIWTILIILSIIFGWVFGFNTGVKDSTYDKCEELN